MEEEVYEPEGLEDLDDYERDTKCLGCIRVISPHGNLPEDATDVSRLIVVRCALTYLRKVRIGVEATSSTPTSSAVP